MNKFSNDLYFVIKREINAMKRVPAATLPAVFIPIFFFFVYSAALGTSTQFLGQSNAYTFYLPVSILLSVSNGGAGLRMVSDIESGYFEKLLLTPVNRLALLIGSMFAELFKTTIQAILVCLIGWVAGASFGLGIFGVIAMITLAGSWGFVFSAIGYTIALRTGNVQATQSAFVIFFPFLFLTSSLVPIEAFDGWFKVATNLNPVTYVLEGCRSLLTPGFEFLTIIKAVATIMIVGMITISSSFMALNKRII
tara:strand:- start:13041 stop:13796 length:756 start_codon:yes stop_codon:yes gene_type:complete